jgi:hypothetical protein
MPAGLPSVGESEELETDIVPELEPRISLHKVRMALLRKLDASMVFDLGAAQLYARFLMRMPVCTSIAP